jgi:tetratricopeptide (TPR) repeat protein
MRPRNGPGLSATQIRAQAYAEERAGRIWRAISLLQEAVARGPDDWTNVRILADLLTRVGQRKAANEHYRRLAQNCELDQLHAQAIAVWKRILANEPESASTQLKLGELYALAGLQADARRHYQAALARYREGGRVPEVAQVEARLASLAGSDKRARPPETRASPSAPEAQAAPTADRGPRAGATSPAPAAPEPGARGDAGHQIGRDDYETRYNLGIAYREMGLLDEAIAELQLAAADPPRLAACAGMVAECFLEQGMPARAVRWLEKGLAVPDLPAPNRRALQYHLAAACELGGETTRALGIYSGLQAEDAGFRDVAERVRRLSGATDPSAPTGGDGAGPRSRGR